MHTKFWSESLKWRDGLGDLDIEGKTVLIGILGARGNVVGWGTMIQAGRPWVRFSTRPWGRLSLRQKWVPGIFLAVKGGRRVRLTSPPSVRRLSRKIWEPRRLTALWVSMACYRDSLTFIRTCVAYNLSRLLLQTLKWIYFIRLICCSFWRNVIGCIYEKEHPIHPSIHPFLFLLLPLGAWVIRETLCFTSVS
jgi:hypothetical protein